MWPDLNQTGDQESQAGRASGCVEGAFRLALLPLGVTAGLRVGCGESTARFLWEELFVSERCWGRAAQTGRVRVAVQRLSQAVPPRPLPWASRLSL